MCLDIWFVISIRLTLFKCIINHQINAITIEHSQTCIGRCVENVSCLMLLLKTLELPLQCIRFQFQTFRGEPLEGQILEPLLHTSFLPRYYEFQQRRRGLRLQFHPLGIHICWKVEREARMDPPIQTEYFLSGGAMILILMVDGARAVISFCILSAIPGYMVVPPDMTVLAYRSFLMSTSHFMMEL